MGALPFSDTTWRIVRLPGRCIRLRGGLACSQCMQACPFDLPLETEGELLGGSAMDRCTGCGACVCACPTDALSLRSRTVSGLLDDLVKAAGRAHDTGPPEVRIACESSGVEADIVVRCIAGIDESMVLSALGHGARRIRLIPGRCEECEVGPRELDTRRFAALQEIGDSLDPPAWVRMERALPLAADSDTASDDRDERKGLDRRSFFGVFRARAIDMLDGADDVDGTRRPSEHGAGEASPGRSRATAALQVLSAELAEELSVLQEAPPGRLSTTGPAAAQGACTFCGDCVRFCPVGALRLRDAEGEARLSVDPSRCVGCGLCEVLCRSDALAMKPRPLERVIAPRRILLARGRTSLCTGCGERFAVSLPRDDTDPGQPLELCPLCSRRAERFKGLY